MKFDEFDGLSSKAWKQRIQFELEGADFNEHLVWKSLEGIDVKPFYHSDSKIEISPIHYQSNQWKIGDKIYVQNVKFANKKASSTHVSRAVPHLSTNPALSRLTSEFGWDPVHLE